jgi:hypothetical protein
VLLVALISRIVCRERKDREVVGLRHLWRPIVVIALQALVGFFAKAVELTCRAGKEAASRLVVVALVLMFKAVVRISWVLIRLLLIAGILIARILIARVLIAILRLARRGIGRRLSHVPGLTTGRRRVIVLLGRPIGLPGRGRARPRRTLGVPRHSPRGLIALPNQPRKFRKRIAATIGPKIAICHRTCSDSGVLHPDFE